MSWEIDKAFSVDYGHRVFTQNLIADYCEGGDNSCKCKFLHGHTGLIHIFLDTVELNDQGFCTDFKHLGWAKDLLDNCVDHKFILSYNDPWFVNIINGTPLFSGSSDGDNKELSSLQTTFPLNTADGQSLSINKVFVPGTEHFAGYQLNVDALSGPEREFFEGFFIVDFVPTSENLAKWLYDCIQAKMSLIDVNVSKISWNETPKSRAVYAGE